MLAIDKRASMAVFIATSLWLLGSITYSMSDKLGFGGSESFWWVFDKVNDRLFSVALLSIASFCFTYILTRLFCYAAILYVIIRCIIEVVYIYHPFDNYDVYWALTGIYCIFILMSYSIMAIYDRSSR